MATIGAKPRALSKPREIGWLPLYTITAALETCCAFTRWLLAYIVLALLALVFGQGHSLVEPLALTFGLGPIALSVLALAWPAGAGLWWRLSSGGRKPSERERAAFGEAVAELHDHRPDLRAPRSWFVLDEAQNNAAVCGDTIMVTRTAAQSPSLPATVAHELGHLHSWDGRVTAAINRFAVLPNLGRTRQARAGIDIGTVISVASLITRQAAYFIWFFASGAFGLWVTNPFWSAYFRRREYAADHYAHLLGQGEQLAQLLEEDGLLFDRPVPFAFMKTENTHPPTELRIDRLRTYENA